MTFRAFLPVVIAMLVLVAAPQRSEAATAAEIDADVYKTLQSFERQIGGARDLAGKAAGILVFPSVVKAGIGLGGEYGEGLSSFAAGPAGTTTSFPDLSASSSACRSAPSSSCS